MELLKEVAPNVSRVAVLRDPTATSGIAQLAAIQTAAASLRLDLVPVALGHVDEIERAVTAFGRKPDGGMIVTAGGAASVNRKLLVRIAAQHHLPAVYSDRVFVADGGLIGYGPDRLDQYPRAASYVDRILRGEKPADLPVQAPTRYELVINLKTAKALGLDVPPTRELMRSLSSQEGLPHRAQACGFRDHTARDCSFSGCLRPAALTRH